MKPTGKVQRGDAHAAGTAAELIERLTVVGRAPLVPEVALRLAREPIGIFHDTDTSGTAQPYWAFAWTAGQGLARWLLDHPGEVAGRRVLDIGAGTAIATIAAMKAGARAGTANDTDGTACVAARLNAALNGVELEISDADLLDGDPEADLILIADMFYEPVLAERVSAFLAKAAQRGIPVLYADRKALRRPPVGLELLATHAAPLEPAWEEGYVEHACVWRVR